MPLVILLVGIVCLILLITWARLNAFIAFVLVSTFVGLAVGMDLTAVTGAIQKGIGDTLGSLVIVIGFGAMLGRLVADSGAAQRIASGLMRLFGTRYVQWALVLTGFIVGVPLFYNVGFVLMMPLIVTVAHRYNLPLVYLGLPVLASLSVTHGYLPPHPSPTALVKQFDADLGLTLLYGILIAIPAIVIAGPLFSLTLKKYVSKPLAAFAATSLPEEQLPGMASSVVSAFLPVLLIALTSLVNPYLPPGSVVQRTVAGLGDPVIVMLVSVLVATYTLGLQRGRTMKSITDSLTESVKDIAMILLIIAGSGALKQVLTDGGVSQSIAGRLEGAPVHPLLLAWSISAFIRVCVGSATVAGLTTAGIVAPLIGQPGVNPNLMVLATGAGSLMFSHVNDGAFWLFKEYFNLTVKNTLRTWSVMETIVSVVGLIGVFVLNSLV
ncbi:MAG: gluconate transporter [Ferruginibacter sp.]|nr:gluconate transporter [Cytophagales bacterium]